MGCGPNVPVYYCLYLFSFAEADIYKRIWHKLTLPTGQPCKPRTMKKRPCYFQPISGVFLRLSGARHYGEALHRFAAADAVRYIDIYIDIYV